MESKRKKSRTVSSCSINDLPSDAIDAILVRLPIRDAVRTSILSRQWRHRWSAMPHLEFMDDELIGLGGRQLADVIDRVLMLHVGPIRTFKLSASSLEDHSSKLDQWIIFLSRSNIKELELRCHDADHYYAVHSYLFTCREITRLELTGCAIKLPSAFDGLAHLASLRLADVKTSPACVLQTLNCPETASESLSPSVRF